MKSITVFRKQSRRLHPWVFSNEVRAVQGNPGPGDVVSVMERNTLVGSAIYSPNSLIRARVFTQENRDLDADLLKERINSAWERRRRWLPGENDFRLVYGESDGLPGLVVDKYGSSFAVQTLACGMEQRLELVVLVLRELFPVDSVYAKNDFSLRELEGLTRYEKLLFGTLAGNTVVAENRAQFEVDIAGGQKTGFYFDQRQNRARIRSLSRDRTVLDVFSYTGGFAVNAVVGGAKEVTAVDTSESALALLIRNAELNQAGEKVKTLPGDAFDVLRRLHQEGNRFDLVIVDPPAFAKGLKDQRRALRGYRDINQQAMRLLSPNGKLLSCSCSQHIAWSDLAEALTQAAQGCGRQFRVIERIGQSPDHPVLLSMPETEYLRSFYLELV